MKFFWIIEEISPPTSTRSTTRLLTQGTATACVRIVDFSIWSRFLRAGVMEEAVRDTRQETPQSILESAVANIYLHELDQYMQRYTALSLQEKRRRRQAGHANFALYPLCRMIG